MERYFLSTEIISQHFSYKIWGKMFIQPDLESFLFIQEDIISIRMPQAEITAFTYVSES